MEIITLIASHIDCKKRLQYFVKLLGSINNQIDYFDTINVKISLSHDTDISQDEILFLIKNINKNNFQVYFQNNKMSQFEHYNFLINELVNYDENNVWILFSDDDDEWSENRLAAYHHMINSIVDDYDKTTCICYTNEKNKSTSTYIGSYTDYCVKLKYARIFFGHASNNQLQHKFCDCYFVKFLCTYGSGKLMRAFCATDDTLYNWFSRKYNTSETTISFLEQIKAFNFTEDSESPKNNTSELEKLVINNLDLYMAQYSNHNAKDWIKFCDAYTNNKISNGEVPLEFKRFIVKLYLDNYDNHMFNTKKLPVYKN